MRLIGPPAKRRRKPGSSSAASSASGGASEIVARRELGFAPLARELVPRADRQAIVAAVDAIADRGAQLRRDRPLVLDRQIGDAAARVEPIGRGEGAASGRRRGRRGRRRNGRSRARPGGSARSVKIAPRNSQEPNSRLTRLVCLPCQPRPAARGQRLLHHRRGVDEDLDFGLLGPRARDEPCRQRLQPALDHVVIVAMARVDRDRAAAPVARAPRADRRPVRSSSPA